MSIVRWRASDPWHALDTLHDEINKLFGASFGNQTGLPPVASTPLVDIWEDKDNIYVETDLPGIDQKDIKVNVRGDNLEIAGKREVTTEDKKKNYYRSERFCGSFYRSAVLPTTVDRKKIKAQYKQGVLKVTLPKREEEKIGDIVIEVE